MHRKYRRQQNLTNWSRIIQDSTPPWWTVFLALGLGSIAAALVVETFHG